MTTEQYKNRADLIAALADLMEDYARAIDRDELELWPGFFEEQCTYKVTSRDNVAAGYPIGLIYADSRAMLEDRVKSLREANIYEDQCYRHILGRPHVVSREADTVRAETSFLVMRIMQDGSTSIFASGSYHDVLRITPERISFIERIVVNDSSRVDTLMALPL